MMYLVCFAVSVLFAYLANKTNDKKKFWLFSIGSIAVMALLSGLRDYSIGIDTLNYFKKEQYWAGAVGAESLFDYFAFYFPLGYGEPLFALLIGIIAQWTGEYSAFLFLAHLIIITCVYIGAYRQRKHVNPAFVLLLFYLFFYHYSLNIIRQYLAVSILFAFLADVQEKKYWRYIVAVVVASMFHTTGIIGLGILVLHFLLTYQHPKLNPPMRLRKTVIAGTAFIGVLFFIPIINLCVLLGFLNERYLFFITENDPSPALIVSAIAVIGLVAADYFRDSMREKSEHYDFYFMCSAMYLILLQLTFTITFGKRISLCFAFADMITLGLIESSPKNIKVRRIVRFAIVFLGLAYWTYSNVLNDANKTFPYQSIF